VASLEASLLNASSIDRCLVAVEHCQAHIPRMGEHESTAKKILHKLKPGHHKDSPDTMDLHQGTKKEDKPLVEQSEHIHSHASHPHIESCAPLLLFCVKIASQAFRCPLLAHHLQLSCHFLPCLLNFIWASGSSCGNGHHINRHWASCTMLSETTNPWKQPRSHVRVVDPVRNRQLMRTSC